MERTTGTAVAGLYATTGALTALWGATLPTTEARLDLGPGRLGAVLLAAGAAALVAMPAAGRGVDRWGAGRLLRCAAPGVAVATVAAILAPGFAALTAAAVALGFLMGALNVALTVAAAAVEAERARPIMSRVHGMWSLGAGCGAATVALGLHLGVAAPVLVVVQAGGTAVCFALLARGLAVDRPRRPAVTGGPAAAPRAGLLVLLGLVGAAVFLVEGAATDWAGVHAVRVLGADPAAASFVYVAFLAAMTAARFAGDAVRARLGAARTVRLAGLTASVGYAFVLTAPVLGPARFAAALWGWLLTGAGTALVWPVVSSVIGAATRGAASRLSVVSAVSYAGALAGPALIGYAAAATSLPAAMALPGLFALAVTLVGPVAVGAAATMPALFAAGTRPGNRDEMVSVQGGSS
jgi:predicted MFS family arabinose efflux permease